MEGGLLDSLLHRMKPSILFLFLVLLQSKGSQMKTAYLGLITVLLTSNCFAQTRLLDVSKVNSGKYLLTIGTNGSISLEPVVIYSPENLPDSPNPNDPVPDESIANQVASIVNSVNDRATADVLSLRWMAIAKLASEKVLSSPQQMRASVLVLTTQVLSTVTDQAKKQEWKEALDKIMAVVAKEESRIVTANQRQWTLEEAIDTFEKVGEGMNALNSRIEKVNWGNLISLLIQIIQLLRDAGIIPNTTVSLTDPNGEPITVAVSPKPASNKKGRAETTVVLPLEPYGKK